MNVNLKLAITVIGAMTVLSGCAETKTFGQGMGNAVTIAVQEFQTGLMGTANTARNTRTAAKQPVNHINSNNIDWTPYLRSMQAGCKIPDLGQIPSQYRSSIGTIQRQGDPNREGEDVTMTYNLVNATAFGYPLQQIEQLQGYEWGHVRLYFKDSRFTALRSQFKPPQNGSYSKLEKIDASGYQFGSEMDSVVMTFNTQNRSITCAY